MRVENHLIKERENIIELLTSKDVDCVCLGLTMLKNYYEINLYFHCQYLEKHTTNSRRFVKVVRKMMEHEDFSTTLERNNQEIHYSFLTNSLIKDGRLEITKAIIYLYFEK